jgi:hypothetical protein
MSIKFKTIFLSVALTGFIFSSATTFADNNNGDDLYPGILPECEQLWVVNDPNNADESLTPPNEGGECIDIPVELKKVKVIFNLDNATTKTSPQVVYEKDDNDQYVLDEFDNKIKVRWGEDGAPMPEDPKLIGTPMTVAVTEPVGLRHMALLGKVMQYRINKKGLNPNDVAIVGIFHGAAMSGMKWGLKANSGKPMSPPTPLDARVNFWMNKIFDLKEAGINIQLEVCGVTLKGMQKSMRAREFPTVNAWKMMDEKAVYGYNTDRRVYVNQGAVARMIDLQRDDFAILQEE